MTGDFYFSFFSFVNAEFLVHVNIVTINFIQQFTLILHVRVCKYICASYSSIFSAIVTFLPFDSQHCSLKFPHQKLSHQGFLDDKIRGHHDPTSSLTVWNCSLGSPLSLFLKNSFLPESFHTNYFWNQLLSSLSNNESTLYNSYSSTMPESQGNSYSTNSAIT